MSYYTRFADTESIVTSSTTTKPGATDIYLMFSAADAKYHAIAAPGISGLNSITTATSTATNIPATSGFFNITSASSVMYSLSTPAVAGIQMTFVNSSTTSTWNGVMTESTGAAPNALFFGAANTAGGGISLTFSGSVAHQYATIVSGASSSGAIGGAWQLVGYSTGVLTT